MVWRHRRSRKRSATSDQGYSPPDLVYFVDRDLGPTVGRILREHGFDVRLHHEVFSEKSAQDSVADDIWIKHCGNNGWVALTRDNDITRTPSSVGAAMQSGARVFILRGSISFQDLANQFVGVRPKVERFLAQHHGPFIAKVKRETFPRGKDRFVVQVELFLDYAGWVARPGG